MKFDKNKLINQTFDKYFETWSHTKDVADFVDEKFLKKLDVYLFKNMKRKLKQADIYDLLILKDKGVKLGLFDKIKIYFSGFEPIYYAEKKEISAKQKSKCKRKKAIK